MQYKIMRSSSCEVSEEQLNALGEEHWQLVTVVPATDEPGTFLYILMRPLLDMGRG